VRRRWLTRTALTVALGLIAWIAISMTAQAEADDEISQARVATDCTHGGPYKDQDVWVFDMTRAARIDMAQASQTDTTSASTGDTTHTAQTAQNETAAQNPEPSATFEGPAGQTDTTKISNQVYDLEGHSVAWLNAPAGWRLVATTPADLRVVGICEAAKPTAINEPAEINKPAAINEPVKTLPQTGQDVGAMVAIGTALVGTGIMLLVVRRKRPSPPPPRHRAGDRVWTYPS
jgi:LPXTG-motif cell wall-anchored protein